MKTAIYVAGKLPAGLRMIDIETMLSTGEPMTSFGLRESSAQTFGIYDAGPTDFRRADDKELRHILLGSPGAIRQTIHLLHSLRYAEPVLWSPVTAVRDSLTITAAQGEAMSLLRRSL
ncbi:MAG: hypothetical protein WA885_06630 [Phormidesmis sp.]